MFEKTLSDLVRGIRSHKGSEAQYISQCMTEIKKELKGGNIAVKANAISKLTYLQMLGYDITWAAFNIIEVMSSTRFTYKRIGYLAATQCFHDDLDIVMLTTNMIKKDLSSPIQYESSLALNGLSCFVTPDIARDIANDVLTLTSSSKSYLKKKAVVVMYKIFLKFPDALRPAFPRLKACLDDPDPGVQCATVSVICELAQKNPKNYLSLAPVLFKLMNSSSNNWMLIKIIKLFGALCPLEPRLGKKLTEPLTSLIHSTSAMSLLYECIATVIIGIPNNTAMTQLCVSKLRLFMEDADQNLKYLGLLAMSPIMQQSPKAVAQVKDIIMDCIEDRDENIRLRALELIMTMATKKNITEIVRKLLGHIDTAESTFFRDTVIEKIITMCSYKSYAHITNFEWYITVLVEMTRFDGTRHGGLIASQLLDVTIRVKDVRPFSVKQMATIVENTHLFVSGTRNGVCEVLYAAAWIVGEFSEYLSDAYPVMEALLHPHVTDLPGHIQAIFVQNIIKLYASILVKAEADGFTESIEEVGAMLVEKLPVFMQSGDLEVQERACGILQLMKYIVKLQSKGAAVADELQKLFVGDLNPVAAKAQRKVPIPEGLDLDQWINDPPSDSDNDKDDDKDDDMNFFGITTAGDAEQDYDEGKNKKRTKKSRKKRKGGKKRDGDGDDDEVDYPNEEDDPEEMEKAREQRRQEIENNPHYLKGSIKPPKREITETTTAETTPSSHPSTKDIPVNRLELGIPLILDVSSESGSKKRGKKSKKKRKQMIEEDINNRPMVDTTSGELPEGAMLSDDEDNKRRERKKTDDDLAMKLDVNLDEPLRDDEVLPVRSHRVVIDTPTVDTPPDEGTKKGKKKKKREESERRKKKKSTSRSKKTDEQEGSLIAIIDEDVTDTIQPAGDEESLDVQPVKEKKKKKKPTGVEEMVVDEGDKKMEDLDFWLTADDVPVSMGKVEEETIVAAEPPMKKEKKKSKKSKKQIKMEETRPAADDITGLLSLELDPPTSTASNDGTTFKLLAEDDSLSMTYDTKGSPMYNNQLTVAIVFSNKTSLQLVSMEFNVLDSLNTKLQRSVGASSQEGLPIPFQLPPGSANECQFIFIVQEFYMPQKLRGTVTYMTKSDDSTAHNKIDFKLCLNPSCFICPTPLPQDRFAALLSGGNLCETVTIKVPFVKTDSFPSALQSISTCLHVKLVELVDDGASLYGQSIAGHHVCILVKDSGNSITVSGKGSDHRLISNLLDEVKTFV